jgi:hypothetical protein
MSGSHRFIIIILVTLCLTACGEPAGTRSFDFRGLPEPTPEPAYTRGDQIGTPFRVWARVCNSGEWQSGDHVSKTDLPGGSSIIHKTMSGNPERDRLGCTGEFTFTDGRLSSRYTSGTRY